MAFQLIVFFLILGEIIPQNQPFRLQADFPGAFSQKPVDEGDVPQVLLPAQLLLLLPDAQKAGGAQTLHRDHLFGVPVLQELHILAIGENPGAAQPVPAEGDAPGLQAVRKGAGADQVHIVGGLPHAEEHQGRPGSEPAIPAVHKIQPPDNLQHVFPGEHWSVVHDDSPFLK